jgi:hypothetical protein
MVDRGLCEAQSSESLGPSNLDLQVDNDQFKILSIAESSQISSIPS